MASVPLRMLEFGPDMQAQELKEEWGKREPIGAYSRIGFTPS